MVILNNINLFYRKQSMYASSKKSRYSTKYQWLTVVNLS